MSVCMYYVGLFVCTNVCRVCLSVCKQWSYDWDYSKEDIDIYSTVMRMEILTIFLLEHPMKLKVG